MTTGLKRRAQSKRKAVEVPARRRWITSAAAAGDSTTVISYVLRNCLVVVPIDPTTIRPAAPSYYKKEKEPKYVPSRQTPVCAQMGLEDYNTTNQGDEHELVKAVESTAFIFNGVWIHANFLAKPVAASSCDVPNYFFAELKRDYKGFCCVSYVKMDPGEPRKVGGCGVCPRQIMLLVDIEMCNLLMTRLPPNVVFSLFKSWLIMFVTCFVEEHELVYH